MTTPPRQKPAKTNAPCCAYVDVSLAPKNNEAQNIRVNPTAKLTEFMMRPHVCIHTYCVYAYVELSKTWGELSKLDN